LSIAYGETYAVLDGNVVRVLARLGAIRGDIRGPQRWKELQKTADGLLEPKSPGDWNQAMMELGATRCTPKSPQCLLCPWRNFVKAANWASPNLAGKTKAARPQFKLSGCGGIRGWERSNPLVASAERYKRESRCRSRSDAGFKNVAFPDSLRDQRTSRGLGRTSRKNHAARSKPQMAIGPGRQGPSRGNVPRHQPSCPSSSKQEISFPSRFEANSTE